MFIKNRFSVTMRFYCELATACMCAMLLSSCAAIKSSGFEDVQSIVDQGLGKEVHWNRTASLDAEVDSNVTTALAEPLTPEKAVAIALLHNRRLQSTFEDLGISRAHLLQAGQFQNPVLSGSFKGALNGGSGPEIELSLVQDVVDLVTMPPRRAAARADFDSVKSEVARQVFSLAAEVQAQFYSVQADEQSLEMMRHVVAATSESLHASRLLFAAGNVRELDLANEEAMHSRTKLDLATQELKARKERERLNILMGLWGTQTQAQIPPRLPEIPESEIDAEDIESRAIAANLELKAISKRIESAAGNLGIERATRLLPQFEFGASFKRETDGKSLLGPAGLLSIPIFNQGQARVAEAESLVRKLGADYHYKAVEIRAASRAAWDHLRLARERALYTKNFELPLSHKILEQSQLEHNAMQIGVFELLRAKRGEIEAGRRYIDDLLDYWLARTEVESILRGHVTEFGMQTTALDSVTGSPLH